MRNDAMNTPDINREFHKIVQQFGLDPKKSQLYVQQCFGRNYYSLFLRSGNKEMHFHALGTEDMLERLKIFRDAFYMARNMGKEA